MPIRRVVPNLLCASVRDTARFYIGLLEFEVVMDLGWIVTLGAPGSPTAQISLSRGDPGPLGEHPVLTIEVEDVDAVNAAALAAGHEVVVALRDESWGVRRFFVRDPDGRVVNVMAHVAG